MKIGDETMFVPHAVRYGMKKEIKAKPVPGIVVWIHPELRFAVVERDTGWYKYRECIRLSRAERTKLK